jgi:membrane-bound lytic murein transglycosylase A
MNDFFYKPILFFTALLLVAGCSQAPVKVTVPGGSGTTSRPIVNNSVANNKHENLDGPFNLETPFFSGTPIGAKKSATTQLYPTQFNDLSGWANDNHVEAFAAFRQSCNRWQKMPSGHVMAGVFDLGSVADWAELCAIPVSAGEERQFFEKWFKPYAIVENGNPAGLFTGYYLPELHGSYTRTERYRVPIYRTPDDLVNVGKKSGRMVGGRLVPHYDRAAIYNGALEGLGLELVWVDDEVDAYFMDVQGSGRIIMEDGSVLGVGYAAKNGHGYFAIGKDLVDRGEIAKADISMQTIRAWIKQHPQEGFELMKKNPSYVFFRATSGETSVGPTGAMGVPLTAQRSLAVDRHYLPLGVPIWLNAQHPNPGQRLQRLVMAQDTGGAIKGAVRGDFYWGQGEQAGELAGTMKSQGQFYLLLPRHLYGGSSDDMAQQSTTNLSH